MAEPVDWQPDLGHALAEAVRGLTALDAEALEALAAFLEANGERLERPRSRAEWARLRSRRWILANLLEGTGRRLEMLRRVSSPALPFASYGRRTARDGARYVPGVADSPD